MTMSVEEIAAKTLEQAVEARRRREAAEFENRDVAPPPNVVPPPRAAKRPKKEIWIFRGEFAPMSKRSEQPTLFDISDSNKPPREALATTHPGQAHFAGTGPLGATCGECAFFNRSKIILTEAGNREMVHYNCEKFFQFTSKHGPAVPASASACRHFQRKVIMGAAKHRRVAAAAAGSSEDGGVVLPADKVEPFFKGLAMQINRLTFAGLSTDNISGLCIFKTLAAYQLARACDLDVSIDFGGLVVRVGPDPHDIITFCGPRNMGCISNGMLWFHCWLRHGDLIFDPSVGDWHGLDPAASEMIGYGKSLPPVQWTVALPSYWLRPAAELELPWRPSGIPALGEAWYGPFRVDRHDVMRRISKVHELEGLQIAEALGRVMERYAETYGLDRPPREHTVYPLRFSRKA